MADGEDRCRAGQVPGPEPGEEFEIVDRSQLPGPGELRRAAKLRAAAEGWSAPILTLARTATGNLSAICGSALCTAAELGGKDGGKDGAARAVVKTPPAKAGDTGSSPGPGRSYKPRATKPVRHNY